MAETTTVPVSIETSNRIKWLSAQRSKELGLPNPLSQRAYIEMLILEEEGRVKSTPEFVKL